MLKLFLDILVLIAVAFILMLMYATWVVYVISKNPPMGH